MAEGDTGRVGSIGFTGAPPPPPEGTVTGPSTGPKTTPTTPEERIAARQAEVQKQRESFVPLTQAQIKDVQQQQKTGKVIIPREQALRGLSGGALQQFLSKATPEERRQLERGTRFEVRLPTLKEVRREREVFQAAPEQPTGILPRSEQFIREKRFEARERIGGVKGQVFGIGLGLISSGISTAQFAKGIVTRPKETITGFGRGFVEVGKRVKTREFFPEIGRTLRREPGFALGVVGGEILIAKGTGKLAKGASTLGRRILTRASPRFRPLVTSPLGEQVIKGVRGVKKDQFDIGLIPRTGQVTPTKPFDVLGRAGEIPLRKKPILPKVTGLQRDILGVVRKKGDVITGSFAQQTLVKGSRKFKDIDILTFNRPALVESLKVKLGKQVKFVKKAKAVTVIERRTGKELADIVPFRLGEKVGKGPAFAKEFGFVDVKGFKLVDPKVRLGSKVAQLELKTIGGRAGLARKKILGDIEKLLPSEKGISKRATFRGGFGYSQKEQAAFIGKTGPVATSAQDIFGKVFKRKVKITKGAEGKGLFATPFDPKTGRAQTRISFLLPGEKEATLGEILRGRFKVRRGKSQIVVFENQKIGKDFKGFGFKGDELEVTLGPGKIIKKAKVGGVTLVQPGVESALLKGRPTQIIIGEIGKPSEKTGRLLKLSRRGKITQKQQKVLTSSLVKETGFSRAQVRSFRGLTTPVLAPSRALKGIPFASRVSRQQRISRGLSGLSGISGFSGISQTRRLSRVSRVSGISGISGFSGVSGLSGISGISGISGFSGLSGVSRLRGLRGGGGTTVIPTLKAPKKSRARKGKRKKIGPKFRFQPSFTASSLRITGKKTKLGGAFQVRPIVLKESLFPRAIKKSFKL